MIEIRGEDVITRFLRMTGLEEAEGYQELCSDAAAQVGAEERPSCGEEGRSALTAAAAALAFYQYILTRAASGAESFSAGDVKVTTASGTPKSAGALWKEAAAAASPYLRDGGSFRFGRVRT